VGRSRSLVGSSKIKKLGLVNKTINNCNRFFSPPLNEFKYVYCLSGVNKNNSKNCAALKLPPFANGKFSANVFTYSITRMLCLNTKPCCEKLPKTTVSPTLILPLSLFSKPCSIFKKVDLPTPFFPIIPILSPLLKV